MKRFSEKVHKTSGCWLWTASLHKDGYGTFWYQGLVQLAHRVSWTLANGPIPEGMSVLHHCDTPACVRPDHLFLGTQLDNVVDMDTKGRRREQRGAANPNAKITDAQVDDIKRRSAQGQPQALIARVHGIAQTHVSRIVRHEARATC
jgi:hypothetical protein